MQAQHHKITHACSEALSHIGVGMPRVTAVCTFWAQLPRMRRPPKQMATSCSSTCGGVKKAVAHVRESIRFCRASERGMASGSCDPAHAPDAVATLRGAVLYDTVCFTLCCQRSGAFTYIRCQTQKLIQSFVSLFLQLLEMTHTKS